MSSICLDGEVCYKWYTSDGILVCRHGVCDQACPMEILLEREYKTWKLFISHLPDITRYIIKRMEESICLE